jgi:rhamnose transport system ATP-binding protein
VSDVSASVLLSAAGVTKTYAGGHALRGASFDLRAGEVHALVGENGAGKSTLVKIFTGAVQPDAGEIRLDGRLVAGDSPRAAKARGVAAVYQQPALFPQLSVAENIALGIPGGGFWTRVHWSERRRHAAVLLARVGARIDPDAEVESLSLPQQQLVEIARAVGADARVLILDEPTASIPEADARNLFAVIGELRARGVGTIYITHRLDELRFVADRVTVLRDGETIDTHAISDVTRDQLIRTMVGRELAAVYPKRAAARGDTLLELRGAGCAAARIRDVNLTLFAGEIVGVAGLVGAGRTRLARVLFGLTPADAGELVVRGTPVHIGSPSEAIAQGIAYLPEDRRRHGVLPRMPITANVTLAILEHLSSRTGMDYRREREITADYCGRLGVKAPSIFTPVSALSGGNQQKVALARWLATKPSVLILDEPTQGIDVGAKSEIHALMARLVSEGIAILMISSELSEILGMSDRIAVMQGGTIVEVVDRAEATQERILAGALGQAPDASASRSVPPERTVVSAT